MTNLVSNIGIDGSATIQHDDASVTAGAAGDASAGASTDGVELGASAAGVGDVATDDVSGNVGAALDGTASATPEGGSFALDGAFDGMLDAMGDLFAELGGSLSAMLGF